MSAGTVSSARRGRPALAMVALALGLALTSLVALVLGSAFLAPGEVLAALVDAAHEPAWHREVVLGVRLPRALVAALAGTGLGVSGAALQGLFRNPLADPGVLGVSSGATLGAVLALYLWPERSLLLVPAAAFVVALLAAGLVYRIATRRGVTSSVTLLLAGIAVAGAFSAATSLVLSLSLAEWELGREVLSWMMGGLEGRGWEHVAALAPPVLVGSAALLFFARDLDALVLGEESALSVGVDVPRTRRAVLVLSALVCGASVAIVGSVAFVGLVVPHVVRLGLGRGHARVLCGSALGGAILLVVADTVSRTLTSIDLRPGALTSALGAPFFVWLLVRTRRAEAGDASRGAP